LTVISQYARAIISSRVWPAKDWDSAYVLGSGQFGRARLSARYDRFWTPGWENGFAYTLFAGWDLSVRQQLGLEYVYARARPATVYVFSSPGEGTADRLLQLNYRLRF
jgi:hypothetical protein